MTERMTLREALRTPEVRAEISAIKAGEERELREAVAEERAEADRVGGNSPLARRLRDLGLDPEHFGLGKPAA